MVFQNINGVVISMEPVTEDELQQYMQFMHACLTFGNDTITYGLWAFKPGMRIFMEIAGNRIYSPYSNGRNEWLEVTTDRKDQA